MEFKVDHSNILKLICTYVTPLKVFIVTELAAGGELLERSTLDSVDFNCFWVQAAPCRIVEQGKFSEKDARSVIRQVLKGVEYLHMRKVVHRDLKVNLQSRHHAIKSSAEKNPTYHAYHTAWEYFAVWPDPSGDRQNSWLWTCKVLFSLHNTTHGHKSNRHVPLGFLQIIVSCGRYVGLLYM
jgi:serine/threonine protein kinase